VATWNAVAMHFQLKLGLGLSKFALTEFPENLHSEKVGGMLFMYKGIECCPDQECCAKFTQELFLAQDVRTQHYIWTTLLLSDHVDHVDIFCSHFGDNAI
jgi:hypothetical protein